MMCLWCSSAAAAALLLLLPSIKASASCDDIRYDDHPDKMSHMPGLNQPLPSDWFSGYLDYELEGRQVHTHYVLVMAEQGVGDNDDDNEDEKPLIYWTNGGPGASSLFGLMTELGPLILSDLSLGTEEYKKTGIPTPIYNSNSWTRLGSILIIDQPAPVGFSYCNDDLDSHSCGGIKWTDELTSLNAYTALQTFFEKKFPCLQSKDLYLTGESYGGIYVPTLARRIMFDKPNSKSDVKFNLKGFAVGDGCLGTHTSICGDFQAVGTPKDFWNLLFMAGHNQIPLKSFRDLMNACHHWTIDNDNNDNTIETSSSYSMGDDDACKAMISKVKKEIGGFFVYSLYDDCTYRNGLLKSSSGDLQGAVNDYPCGGGPVMEDYFKMDVVKGAFHVKSTFFEVDNAEGDFDYTPTEPDLTGFYKQINGKGVRVLIYNGDTDPAITSFAAQNWTSHLGFDEAQSWRPWTIDGCQRMGGYVTRYQGDFDFLTIRGAGHMVPTYKPEATFSFLKSWIQDIDYPTFNPNCTQPHTTFSSSNVASAQMSDLVTEKKDSEKLKDTQDKSGTATKLRKKT